MKQYHFQTAGRIISGENRLEALTEELQGFTRSLSSVLIVTQKPLKDLGFTDGMEKQLRGKGVAVDYNLDILPEPTIDNMENVYTTIKDKSYDALIGIGGGSVLDATKILSVLMTNDQSISDMLGTELVKERGLPMVLIPTTSGTGSEVTPNAIVTLPDEELKVGVVSKYLLPDLVILDPTLTVGLPKPITAATGMDAFTHSLESFISNKANPFSDMFALESIRLISKSILTAYETGTDLEARENMLVGSMYGGMALTAAGTAAVHALAYPLGGKYHIPHGEANSMLLPHVMRFNMDAIEARLSLVAEPMGIDASDLTERETAEKVIGTIEEWTTALNIPQNLADYGIGKGDLNALAVSASKVTRLLNNNPKEVSIDEMEKIYAKLLP